jgi:hypothetical protein
LIRSDRQRIGMDEKATSRTPLCTTSPIDSMRDKTGETGACRVLGLNPIAHVTVAESIVNVPAMV